MKIAVIPARGGSKSVPGKNLINLGGKPLIAWSIETAEHINVDRVIVTTDSEEIAEVSTSLGAEVIRRPLCLSDDHSTDYQWSQHLLQELDPHLPDMIVQLRPTCPFRDVDVVNEAIDVMRQCMDYADSLRSVSVARQTPYKMWKIEDAIVYTVDPMIPVIHMDRLVPVLAAPEGIPEPYNAPRQRLPLILWQNGYVDITKPQTILVKQSMTGEIILPFIVEEEAPDLDYASDLSRLERTLEKSNPYPS